MLPVGDGTVGSETVEPQGARVGRLHAWVLNRRIRRWIVFLVVTVGFATSIVYTNVQTYNRELTPTTGYPDTLDYLRMYEGEPGSGIRAYRLFVPTLARLVPELPRSLFNPGHRFDPATIAATKFGVLNLFFLVGACAALLVLGMGFGLTYLQAFLAVLLFLGSQTIVRSAGLPMVDAAFFLFFLLCLVAIQRNNVWLFFVSHTLGMITKELVALSVPLILLSLHPPRRKRLLVLAALPGVAAYVVVRLASPAPLDAYVSGEILQYVESQLRFVGTPNGLINLFTAFGLAWFPAIYVLATGRAPRLLKRWSWLLPLVTVGVLVGAGNLGRSMFTAFPVVMPLAALGLTQWARRLGVPEGEPSKEQSKN